MIFKRWIERYEKFRAARGYTCDGCGAEIFSYPERRLCAACEESVRKIVRACEKCGRSAVTEGICLECKADMPLFDFAVSAFEYKDSAAALINRFKNGEKYLVNFFAEALLPVVQSAFFKNGVEIADCLFTCVPDRKEDRKSRRERKYNPAEILAKRLCELLEVPFRAETLVKSRETRQQKRMRKKERFQNVRGAYRVHERAICRGKTVAVIDDILTTGATGCECARILSAAGAKRVVVITAASVPEEKNFPTFAE